MNTDVKIPTELRRKAHWLQTQTKPAMNVDFLESYNDIHHCFSVTLFPPDSRESVHSIKLASLSMTPVKQIKNTFLYSTPYSVYSSQRPSRMD